MKQIDEAILITQKCGRGHIARKKCLVNLLAFFLTNKEETDFSYNANDFQDRRIQPTPATSV